MVVVVYSLFAPVLCVCVCVSSTVPVNGMVQVPLTSDGCNGDVRFLEHVEAVVTMSASVRGQVTGDKNCQLC